MVRNPDIQKIFEIADDSVQGALGYHFYVIALKRSSNILQLESYLPENIIPHTFSWDRYYKIHDLAFDMWSIFESYQ